MLHEYIELIDIFSIYSPFKLNGLDTTDSRTGIFYYTYVTIREIHVIQFYYSFVKSPEFVYSKCTECYGVKVKN